MANFICDSVSEYGIGCARNPKRDLFPGGQPHRRFSALNGFIIRWWVESADAGYGTPELTGLTHYPSFQSPIRSEIV
ncbi:hypothetical protein DENIS_2378 [Desulfonema ishimotonii]|uniref:Uncharacterized protein n=1 Tax=Desulfonema ishimotonii TaxID=45657 RepID=A0A401FWR7_9BACT|nr:hypothetical protein DENIS_2378 [Desulfonema ishimotonii]